MDGTKDATMRAHATNDKTTENRKPIDDEREWGEYTVLRSIDSSGEKWWVTD
jgi:hypothetical protein